MALSAKKQEYENSRRNKLREEKPLVYDKIIKFPDMERRGLPTSRIDIGYNYACNLKCDHCMAMHFRCVELQGIALHGSAVHRIASYRIALHRIARILVHWIV